LSRNAGFISRMPPHWTVMRLLFVAVLVGLLLYLINPRHTIWYNAQLLALDDAGTKASAVSWRRGIIEAMGSDADVLANKRWYTRVRDMRQQTVLPGLIDVHSHFPAIGVEEITVDIASPPLGTVQSLEQLYKKISTAAQLSEKEEWIIGFNYDQASLQEGTHPTLAELDRIVPSHPVYVYHSSGHMGVANSAGLKKLGLRPADNPSGLLQESAAPSMARLLSDIGLFKQWKVFQAARQRYLAAGITTVNSGAASPGLTWGLRLASALGFIPLRVVVNSLVQDDLPGLRFDSDIYTSGATKVIVDGSPQGFTALLTDRFYNPPNVLHVHGRQLVSAKDLNLLVQRHADAGVQLALHGNGDAAIDLILDAIEAAGLDRTRDHRSIVIHAQTARRDQLARMAELGAVPSFFVSHVYYWGDWHAERVLGPEKAQHISPTGWAIEEDLRFSLHTDSPVTPVSLLAVLQYAAERRSFSGRSLGPEHRLDVVTALRAVTLDAAWQHFLEEKVGSLEVGKFADLVALSRNPLDIPVSELTTIKVLTTVIDGEVEYMLQE